MVRALYSNSNHKQISNTTRVAKCRFGFDAIGNWRMIYIRGAGGVAGKQEMPACLRSGSLEPYIQCGKQLFATGIVPKSAA